MQRVFSRLIEIVACALPQRQIKTVFEVGARDCVESALFAAAYPQATVFAFECNPATLPACRAVAAANPRVKLTEKAVSDRAGVIAFYPTDPARSVTGTPHLVAGASSLFVATGKYPEETYVQNQIEVEAITLADFMHANAILAIDLMWMDVQGAELLVLAGLGERTRDVACVHMEVEFFEIYQGQALFGGVHAKMTAAGFMLAGFSSYSRYAADAVYFRVELGVSRLGLWRRHPYLLRNWRKMLQHRCKRWLLRTIGRPEWPAPKSTLPNQQQLNPQD